MATDTFSGKHLRSGCVVDDIRARIVSVAKRLSLLMETSREITLAAIHRRERFRDGIVKLVAVCPVARCAK